MRPLLMAGFALSMLLGAPAMAHEGGAHSMGTVKEITGEKIVLATKEGKVVAIPLAPGTRILRGDQAIRPADVRPGERAVVHSAMHEGKVEATEVRVGSAPRS